MRQGRVLPSRRTWRRWGYVALARLRPLTVRPGRQAIATAAVLTLTVLAVWWLRPPSSRPVPTPQPSRTGVITTSTDHPSEAAIAPDTYRSTATGSEPKLLRLPSIKVEGYIQKVGVDQYHQIAVPTNIHLAGWFSDMALPGDPGLSIIDGHLDGYKQPGIFASLVQLAPGATFEVELATGAIRHFQVRSVQSVPTDQAASLLFSQTPGISSQLNLITCGGTFDKTKKAYNHRVIVTSEAIK